MKPAAAIAYITYRQTKRMVWSAAYRGRVDAGTRSRQKAVVGCATDIHGVLLFITYVHMQTYIQHTYTRVDMIHKLAFLIKEVRPPPPIVELLTRTRLESTYAPIPVHR
jgi:hypothetical protein